MRIASTLLPGLFALLVPMMASAHDQLPPNWCPVQGTRPVVATTYSFSPATLQAYRNAHQSSQQTYSTMKSGTSCGEAPQDCGIVDDWYWANRMAQEYCGTGTASTSSTYRSIVPLQNGNISVASSPSSFLSANHHADYRFSSGNLVGACYACVPSGSTTARDATLTSSTGTK